MIEALQQLAMRLVDSVMARIPRARPDVAAVRKCRIISHRGEHDNQRVFENTLQAFEAARTAGVWGIECDIRWTADQVPVIHHDAEAHRLYGVDQPIAAMSLAMLRHKLPLVPTLEEVVARFGGNTHLMLELKQAAVSAGQQEILQRVLRPLQPIGDFHFLALQPALFEQVPFVPSQACLLVAEINIRHLSAACLQSGWGGLTGHYLLFTAALQARHRLAGQGVGTGFVASRNGLYRELNRGVEWIFSNDAVAIQAELDKLADAIGA